MAQAARHVLHQQYEASSFDDRPRTPVSPIAPHPNVSPSHSNVSSSPGNRRSKHVSVLSFDGEELTWAGAAMSRPGSAASDRFSVVSGLTQHFPGSPLNIDPAPAYVAPAGAAQVVIEHRSLITGATATEDAADGSPGKEDISFSESALSLINLFLDQLLYSFLANARATSMAALRPAVTDVLKQRLARDAIMSAEEELSELLAGGDDEAETDAVHDAGDNKQNWDLELVWKRTRLRVMVYIRLGEMEDEDEQRYVREEELFHASDRRFSSTSGLVSWAAAIFLTSVLEYIAEQTLQVAGSAAHARVLRHARPGDAQLADARHVAVEEHDVEKVALSSTLGRLWRTWRKSLRNHANSGASMPTSERSPSAATSRERRDMNAQREPAAMSSDRRPSAGESARPSTAKSAPAHNDTPESRYSEDMLAANIPLPLQHPQRDVHEIEVPGLAADPEMNSLLQELLLSDLALAAHTPMRVSERDVHEIEVPGLARDPHGEDESQDRHAERMYAARLSLPCKDEPTDVAEIEVPGLAVDPDAQQEPAIVQPARRSSFSHPGAMQISHGLATPASSQPRSPVKQSRGVLRRRSSSVPTLSRTKTPFADVQTPPLPEPTSQPAIEGTVAGGAPSRDGGEESQDSDGGVIAGAVAGAVAAGAAAAAAVFGSRSHAEQDDRVQPAPDIQEQSGRFNGNKTAAEIEELDKRKSLLDIKAIAGLHNPTTSAASASEPREPANGEQGRTDVPDVNTSDSKLQGHPSYESYSLSRHMAGKSAAGVEEISSIEGPQDAEAIGVAQTADVPFASLSGLRGMDGDARDNTRPTRTVIGEDSPDGPTIKQIRKSIDAGGRPRSFSRKSEVSLTDQNRYVAQQIAQQRGIPGSPASSRGLRSDSVEQYGTSPHSKQGRAVQEHPAVQRMASLKRNKPAIDEQGNTLTSASIRGPEDFDMFVQGGETMKYTLTPEAVRDASVKLNGRDLGAGTDTPVSPLATSNAEALRQLEAGAEIDGRKGRNRSEKTSVSTTEEEEARKRQHRRSISRPPTTNTKSHSRSGKMAREPRVQTESTRDFADFIRSTGPDKESAVYPLMSSVSTTSLSSLRSAHINGASASRSSSPAGSRRHSLRNGAGEENVPPVPALPPTSKGSMQPRGASGVSHGNSDLIDFIRSGPVDKDKHRISRSVAPFRNTMDSEQFRDMDARLSNDKPLDLTPHTHNAQSVPSSSQRTSVNSRSALLHSTGNAATAHPAYSGTPQTLSSPTRTAQVVRNPSIDNSEPTRKRYRNKDPYAIDLSDEDDDLVTALPKNGPRREESLMDFLNSMEPPKDSGKPEPLINPNSAQAKKLIQSAKDGDMNTSTRSLHGDGRARTAQQSNGQRTGYANSVSSARTNMSRPQQPISASNAPRRKMEARTPDRAQQDSTNDLASFLRDSGPPEDPESAPAPVVRHAKTSASADKEKKRSGLGFFGRTRKKQHIEV